MKRAESNLARARLPRPALAYWEDFCFDAQQAAEKSMKALCILKRLRFPLSHDIGSLVELLERAGVEIPDQVRASAFLTDYATATCYPGWGEPVTEAEFNRALGSATQVVEWCKTQFTMP